MDEGFRVGLADGLGLLGRVVVGFAVGLNDTEEVLLGALVLGGGDDGF